MKSNCTICEKTFQSKKYLKVHMTKLHTSKSNSCGNCDYINHNKTNLQDHIEKKHADDQTPKLLLQSQAMDMQTTINNRKMKL